MDTSGPAEAWLTDSTGERAKMRGEQRRAAQSCPWTGLSDFAARSFSLTSSATACRKSPLP